MKLIDHNGKKTAVICMLIDLQNGFRQPGIPDGNGGSLYVPGGEEAVAETGNIIKSSRGTTFIMSADAHPGNHISFMVNHPGVMEYRIEKFKAFLAANSQPMPATPEDLYVQAQQPAHFFNGFDQLPAMFYFPEIVLDENRNIIGLKEGDGRIRQVRVDTSSGLAPDAHDRGRVTKVLDEYCHRTFDEYRAEGRLLNTQTLWTKHCVQTTESCGFPDALNLPQGLQDKLRDDAMSKIVYFRDKATDNEYWIIRKGANSEIDSYGIGVENDGETLTKAWEVYTEVAKKLKSAGCENVVHAGGGLATNFCYEFSQNNAIDFLAAPFKMRGMQVEMYQLPEICRGIPFPGGIDTPFSLDGAPLRLKARGVEEMKVAELLAMTAPQPAVKLARKFAPPSVGG